MKKIRDNFDVRIKQPLDSRMSVENLSDIESPYDGLITYQKSDECFYKYKNGVPYLFQNLKGNIFKKEIFKQLPLLFSDYNTIITQETLDYIYPQAFTIDWNTNEIFILYLADTQSDIIKKWVVVYDLITSTYKMSFHVGFGFSEGIVIKYESSSRFLYVESTNQKIGKYNISTLPTNLTSLSPMIEYDVGLYSNFSYNNGTWLVEQDGAGLGANQRRTNFAFYDESFTKIGSFNIDVGATGAWNSSLANYLSKRQDLAIGNGVIYQSMGGIYFKGNEPIPYNNTGIVVLNSKGEVIEEGIIDPKQMIYVLESLSIVCDRIESEGIHVAPNGDVYSLIINQSRNIPESLETGIIIFKEFSESENAIDFSSSSVINKTFNRIDYETGIAPRSSDGKMYNPLTGELFDTLAKIINFMSDVDLKSFTFYSSSVTIADINGVAIPAGGLVKITNANNTSFIMEIFDSGNKTLKYRIYDNSNTKNWIQASQDTGEQTMTLSGTVQHFATGQELTYRRNNGEVTIEGAVKNITAIATLIANIPSGYRPLKSKSLAMAGSGNRFNRFTISTSGDITFDNTSYVGTLLATEWYPIYIRYYLY